MAPDPFKESLTGLVAARALSTASLLWHVLDPVPRAVDDGTANVIHERRRGDSERWGAYIRGLFEMVSAFDLVHHLPEARNREPRDFAPSEIGGWMREARFAEVEAHRNERSPWVVVGK